MAASSWKAALAASDYNRSECLLSALDVDYRTAMGQ
jgi:hypothetical protein